MLVYVLVDGGLRGLESPGGGDRIVDLKSRCSREPLDLCGLRSGFGEGDLSCERWMAESGERLVDAPVDMPVGTGFRRRDDRGGTGGGLLMPRSTTRFDLRGEAGRSERGTVLAVSTDPPSSTIV